MKTDHLQTFPLPEHLVPETLRRLLAPGEAGNDHRVDVLVRTEHDMHGPSRESVHMLMAVIPEDKADAVSVLRESSTGLVEDGTPDMAERGAMADWSPAVSTFGYIVAAWGDSLRYGYALSERVWMMLGLVPRGFGNEVQRITYDDLAAPVFDVASGELSSSYYFEASRNVRWTMSNAHLRRYLWLNKAVGTRVFSYEGMVDDCAEVRALMDGEPVVRLDVAPPWCEVYLREHKGRILIQVAGTVTAVPPVLLPEPDATTLVWPDIPGPMSANEINGRAGHVDVYLDDRVLEHYERDTRFDTMPVNTGDNRWSCSPGYGGQWAFTGWVRVGRNLIRVSLRDLHKGVPDAEVVRAHAYALPRDLWSQRTGGEHVVAKVDRLVAVLLDLADHLARLSGLTDPPAAATEIFRLDRREVRANGWGSDATLKRLSQVVPLDMDEQAFLARCKVLHERLQVIPKGVIKRILRLMGISSAKVKDLGSFKLIQAAATVLEDINRNLETVPDSLPSDVEPEGWDQPNAHLAALFVLNDLRIADAHVVPGETLRELERLGFDIAGVNGGYGLAFDFVLDHVIGSLGHVEWELRAFVER